mmetsp:Transcript_15089/g.49654  ORF Transcript_15089/g.49654 Transcript_15089/m.49654 type:complete len:322 (-) Transcript_15089:1346-2311(-)
MAISRCFDSCINKSCCRWCSVLCCASAVSSLVCASSRSRRRRAVCASTRFARCCAFKSATSSICRFCFERSTAASCASLIARRAILSSGYRRDANTNSFTAYVGSISLRDAAAAASVPGGTWPRDAAGVASLGGGSPASLLASAPGGTSPGTPGTPVFSANRFRRALLPEYHPPCKWNHSHSSCSTNSRAFSSSSLHITCTAGPEFTTCVISTCVDASLAVPLLPGFPPGVSPSEPPPPDSEPPPSDPTEPPRPETAGGLPKFCAGGTAASPFGKYANLNRPWFASKCVHSCVKFSASRKHNGHVIPVVVSALRSLPRWYR